MVLTVPSCVQQTEGQEVRFICRCSFLEIYKEVITDLLNPAATRLQIREDFKQGIHVEGLQEDITSSGCYSIHFTRTCFNVNHLHMVLPCFCLASRGSGVVLVTFILCCC